VWADEPRPSVEPATLQAAYLEHDGHPHGQVHADDAGYVAFAFEHDRPLDETRFREFLGSLPFEVFRVKGTVRFPDRTELINLVGGRGDRELWQDEQATRLAFGGWDVDGDEILGRLAACVAAG
jgi:G3E family GTPase